MQRTVEPAQPQAPRVTRRRALRAVGGLALGGTAASFVAPWFAACTSRSGPRGAAARVTAYVSADDALAREVLAACTKATGIEVDAAFDTEANKTVGLERRLIAERDRPRADLFWSSEGFAAAASREGGRPARVARCHRGRVAGCASRSERALAWFRGARACRRLADRC